MILRTNETRCFCSETKSLLTKNTSDIYEIHAHHWEYNLKQCDDGAGVANSLNLVGLVTQAQGGSRYQATQS